MTADRTTSKANKQVSKQSKSQNPKAITHPHTELSLTYM